MTTKLPAVAFTSSLLMATALMPAGAADMTQERTPAFAAAMMNRQNENC